MTQFWGVARSVFISVTFSCIFFENVAYIAQVEGVSMQPTLNEDPPLSNDPSKRQGIRGYLDRINGSDLVLLSHWSTRNFEIRRGDIVSLISPKNPRQVIIKRVIGLEGKSPCCSPTVSPHLTYPLPKFKVEVTCGK